MSKLVNRYTLAIPVLVAGYLAYSEPSEIVVNDHGQIEGLANKARAALQGQSFWKQQLALTDQEYQYVLAQPIRDAEQQLAYERLDAEFDQTMRKIDREINYQPSPEQLRIQAAERELQEAEQAQIDKWLQEAWIHRLQELRAIAEHISKEI